jgi:hypothetical protein
MAFFDRFFNRKKEGEGDARWGNALKEIGDRAEADLAAVQQRAAESAVVPNIVFKAEQNIKVIKDGINRLDGISRTVKSDLDAIDGEVADMRENLASVMGLPVKK